MLCEEMEVTTRELMLTASKGSGIPLLRTKYGETQVDVYRVLSGDRGSGESNLQCRTRGRCA